MPGARVLVRLSVLALGIGILSAQDLPRIGGESLSGRHVILPDAVSGRVAVLVLGFTKASKTPTTAWGARIETDFASNPEFVLYQLPVLEDVPGIIRGMVISSIKKSVPEKQRDHFVPVLHGEGELRKLVSYKEQDDAYLIVLDRKGSIVYQMHGALSEPNYTEFRQHIMALLR